MSANDNNQYFGYLDALRESGATNMMGATPYLIAAFPELDRITARGVLMEWMRTYEERHPN